jgi:hypothetical protein
MGSVTPEDARQHLERWKLAEEREITELRNTPIEIKARQLAALMASRTYSARIRTENEGYARFRPAGLDSGKPSVAERAPVSRQDIEGVWDSPLRKQLLQ